MIVKTCKPIYQIHDCVARLYLKSFTSEAINSFQEKISVMKNNDEYIQIIKLLNKK